MTRSEVRLSELRSHADHFSTSNASEATAALVRGVIASVSVKAENNSKPHEGPVSRFSKPS